MFEINLFDLAYAIGELLTTTWPGRTAARRRDRRIDRTACESVNDPFDFRERGCR
jgi:hypothetical protein